MTVLIQGWRQGTLEGNTSATKLDDSARIFYFIVFYQQGLTTETFETIWWNPVEVKEVNFPWYSQVVRRRRAIGAYPNDVIITKL